MTTQILVVDDVPAMAEQYAYDLKRVGKYDAICILEAEDEASLVAFNVGTAQQGNVRSQSLRALTAVEFDKVLAKLP